MNKPTERKSRRPYEAPRLRRIRLAADEVMAKGCKMATPSAGFQGSGCLSGGCSQNGS
ncbi:MAG: hypothetical protein ACI8W7_001457 [Gammaproteobacteria bacterium]|jgi:hypothetical protein